MNIKFIMLIASIFMLVACTNPMNVEPQKQILAPLAQAHKAKVVQNKTYFTGANSNNCLVNGNESITCSTKRATHSLQILNTRIDMINNAFGACNDCSQ